MLPLVSQAGRSWKSAKRVAFWPIYTVVNAVMLKPLPYAHGERFVALYGARFSEPEQRSASTYPDMLGYRQRTHSFDVFGWFRMKQYNLTSPGQPQHINGVPEALNPSEEEFGEDRLKELLGHVAHLPADEMSLRISEEVKNWIRDAPQYDDLTFIVMKVAS